MKRKWLFASLLLTAALTMTSCSFKLPVELPFKIPFITADRNTKQNDEDPSDPEKTTDPIITDEPEVPENIDTTETTQSGSDHGSHTPDEADPSPSQPDEDPVDAPSGQEVYRLQARAAARRRRGNRGRRHIGAVLHTLGCPRTSASAHRTEARAVKQIQHAVHRKRL